MAIKASHLNSKIVPVVVQFLGEELHIKASPVRFNEVTSGDELNDRSPIAYGRREDEAAKVAREAAHQEAIAAGKSEDEAALTGRQAERETRKAAEKYNGQDYIHGVMTVVTEWDYVDDSNEPLPINEEIVAEMWPQLRNAIWSKILEAMTPKSMTALTRHTGSARTGR